MKWVLFFKQPAFLNDHVQSIDIGYTAPANACRRAIAAARDHRAHRLFHCGDRIRGFAGDAAAD
jgi:hypothetical protein